MDYHHHLAVRHDDQRKTRVPAVWWRCGCRCRLQSLLYAGRRIRLPTVAISKERSHGDVTRGAAR